eukprot:CAMPEP_0198532352 /NCGR_PEP_ID=MMETSP1462-20131121/30547_1 /TAXON_ID=1333877 /ORGANISM="Brandtodinium nutriculum, Strain RCC3387" /LENGTH=30 /DNA_ID= /DNA_START= /DNA_END= /DNA_ORIENTATION=
MSKGAFFGRYKMDLNSISPSALKCVYASGS